MYPVSKLPVPQPFFVAKYFYLASSGRRDCPEAPNVERSSPLSCPPKPRNASTKYHTWYIFNNMLCSAAVPGTTGKKIIARRNSKKELQAIYSCIL